jgi:hypothetical protein
MTTGPVTRAIVLVSALVVITTGMAWRQAGTAEAEAPLYFGAFPGARSGQTPQQATQALESTLGRPLAVVRDYLLWDSAFPTSYENWLRDSGHIIALSVKALRANGTRPRWIDIANAQPGSQLYNNVVSWATRVRGFGGPIWFIFHHEPEATSNNSNGSASDFIAAWRRVITIFRAQGVTNAKYIWTATDYAFWRTDGRRAELWYPGDAYVDAIAADAYNWYNCRPGIDNPWWSLQQVIDPLRRFGQGHPDKELMLMEFGSYEDPAVPGRKAAWFNAAQQLFKQPGWEQFTAIVYYNTTLGNYPNCRWWIDTSQSSLDAFRSFATDAFYGRLPGGGDTTAPSVPGKPSGVSNTSTTINVSWVASDDDVATSITYRVYRDGGTNAVGTVTSSSTTTVSFTDTSLAPGSTHTYEVTASDGQNTSARSPASDPITVQSGPAAIFADGFGQGFANWTGVAGMTVDNATGNPSAPSARAQPSGAPAWAWRTLGATYPSACLSVRVNLSSIGSTVDLFRLRTASDGPIVRAYVASNRVLWIRADFSGSQLASSTVLPLGSWNTVELCTTVGTSGSATLYLNGTRIAGPWTANLGTTPIGRIQIGDNAAKTFTANWDDVVLDQTPI